MKHTDSEDLNRTGSVLSGRYRLDRLLGSGGMGAVYAATDLVASGQSVALKVLHSQDTIQWFRSEFATVAQMRHPHIARVLDFGLDSTVGVSYSTSELCAGRSATQALAGSNILDIVGSCVLLLDTLDYIHGQGFLHCDIKPDNVLIPLPEPGRPDILGTKVLDFGLAVAVGSTDGKLRGTLAYMAPEWLSGGDPGPGSDLYSLAVMMYEATYGELPYRSSDPSACLDFHARGTFPFSPDDGTPVWWTAFLKRMLARNPLDRFETAQTALESLPRSVPEDHRLPPLPQRSDVGGPFVGRQSTLDRVFDHIDSGLRGAHAHGLRLTVHSDARVGRSRLLQECKRRAQLAGSPVVLLRPEISGPDTFPQFESEIAASSHEHPIPLSAGPLEHRVHRLVQSIVTLTSSSPLLLLVDDVHLLDVQTSRVLEALGNTVQFLSSQGDQEPRLAVVVTEPSEVREQGPGEAGASSDRLLLAPVSQASYPRLLATFLGAPDVPAGLLEEAWQVSRGNPGLTLDFLACARSAEALYRTTIGLQFQPDRLAHASMPGGTRDRMERSLASLPREEVSVLQVLSEALLVLDAQEIADALGLPHWRIRMVLDSQCRGGFVTSIGGNQRKGWTLSSQMMADVVRTTMNPDQLQALHLRIVAAVGNSDHPGRAALLAWHGAHAGKRDLLEEHLDAAIEHLLSRSMFARALAVCDVARMNAVPVRILACRYFDVFRLWGRYEEGIQVLRKLLPPGGSASLELDVHLFVAELLFLDGRYEPCLEEMAPLVDQEDQMPGSNAGTAAGLALMARAKFYLGSHDEARKLGEKGMLLLPEGTREFALCAIIVGLVRVYQGKSVQGQKYLLLAMDTLETVGTFSDHAFAANALALSYHKAKEYEEARRFYLVSHDVASRAGDQERAHIALMNLSVVAQETANYGEAISRYRAVLAMAVQTSNRPVLARVLANLGTLHRYLGLLEKARTYATDSLSAAVELKSAHQIGLATMLLGEIAAFGGDNEEASRRLEEARTVFEGLQEQDECLEVDIDRLELAILAGTPSSVLPLAGAVQDIARTLGLVDHRVRASLAACWAYLEDGSSSSLPMAAGALAFVRSRESELENPEHRWRLAVLELWNEQASGSDGVLPPLDVHKVEKSFADLKNRIPPEFQTSFLQRIDRAQLLKRSEKCQKAVQATRPGSSALPTRPDGLLTGARWMTRIVAVNRRMLGDATLEQLLESIIDEVVDLSGAERGFVILGNEDRLDVVAARNMDREGVRRSKTKFSTTVARGVLRTGEMVMLEDAVESDDYRDQVSIVAQRIRSVIALPLTARGQTIGALYLDHRFRGGVFSHDVVEMLKAFSEQAALAVENKRLLERFRETVTELEASRNEVQRLNQKLQEKISVQETLLRQQSQEIDLQQEQLSLQSQFSSILGRSKAIQTLFGVMNRVKNTSVPVLVTGESGTGKELVARALHFSGPRSKKRFVSINCAALPDTLLESELFGYSKGAFTGAAGDKKGLFALADQGTLLLDEVGDMSLTMQAKILRVLQEGEFSPLGSERLTKVDVRVISATNRNLKSMVKTGEFREDLYYRLDVVSIRVPPLRDRSEDIPLLVDHFLQEFGSKNEQAPCRVAPDAMHSLMTYAWPGNVRELHSVIMTASVFARDGLITAESLQTKPEVLAQRPSRTSPRSSTLNLRDLERMAIEAALEQAGGNKVRAAKLLGLSRRALYNKLGA